VKARLDNVAPILVSTDLRRTVAWYREMLGFKAVEHYDSEEPFAALYRDSVELVIVQAERGQVESNRERYGVGHDVYIDPDDLEGVKLMYDEAREKGVEIVQELGMTSYGSLEFAIGDVDGRVIGIGRIADRDVFFVHEPR
jgi:catechol 2,3-dioxygenase-like lactoylglutathione lyase family enzyme